MSWPARGLQLGLVRASLAGLAALVPSVGEGLEGLVKLRDGRAAAGAEVSILGLTGLAVTDREGRFSWTPDPTPPFEVLVVLNGAATRPVRVTALPAEGPLSITAEPAVDESVTVTAGAAPHVTPPPAAGTTLLAAPELERRAPANLAQALENVAGVASVSEGQAAVPAVRGLAHGRTLVLLDGARVTTERRVGPSATYLDPALLESVEVSRGPGAMAYGSDAFGGVIDARTRRATPGSGWGGRLVGDLGAGIPQRRASLELTRGLTRGGLLAQAHYRGLDDYDGPEDRVFNSGSRDFGGRVRLDHVLGAGLLSLGVQRDFARDVERPRTNSGTLRFFYPREDSTRLVASWEASNVLGLARLGASGFLGRYSLLTDQDAVATASTPRTLERADVSARDFHLRSSATRPAGVTRLELGLEVNGRFGLEALEVARSYSPGGAVASERVTVSVDGARRSDAAAWLSALRPLGPRAQVEGGLRLDRVATTNRGGTFGDRSTDAGAFAGFAAVTARGAGGLSASAQVSRGFRDPALSDRYFSGPSGRGSVTGNPGLRPETSLQVDLALRYAGARWRAALYAYQYRIAGLIERYETSADVFFFRNRGRARLRGLEAEAQARLAGGLSLELAAHLIRGEALDDGAPLDDVPPATLTAKLARQLGRGFVQARAALYAGDERPGPTEQPRRGYGLLDLAGGWRFGEGLELRLAARNLLNESYLVSPDPRAVLAPGRSALLTAVVGF